MKQLNFNNQRGNLSENDIDAIIELIGHRCRVPTIRRLRSMLTYGRDAIPHYGILERLMKDDNGWSYCAGQSYPDEIKTIRNIILEGK